jgi:hypothetical protein
MSPHGESDDVALEVVVSDPSEMTALMNRLRAQRIGEVRTRFVPPASGEQGGHDVIVALASSGGLLALLRMLPEFLRARRSNLRIETTVKGEKFVLKADNVAEVMPILERFLRD